MVTSQPVGTRRFAPSWERVLSEVPTEGEEPAASDSEAAEWAGRLARRDRQSAGLLLTTLEAWAEPRIRIDLMQAANSNADRRLSSASGSDAFGGSLSRVMTTVSLGLALVLICVVPIALMDDSRNPGHFVSPLGAPALIAGVAGIVAVGLFAVGELRRPRRVFYHPALYVALALWNAWGLWFTISRVAAREEGSWSALVMVGSILTAAAVVSLVALFFVAWQNPSVEDVVMREGAVAEEYDGELRRQAAEIIARAPGIDRSHMRANVVPGVRVLLERGLISEGQAVWMLNDLYS